VARAWRAAIGSTRRCAAAAVRGSCATLVMAGVAQAITTTVAHPFLGVTHTRITTTVPRQLSMNLIEVDLDVQGIGFVVTPSNGATAGETIGKTTRQFAAEAKTQVAVNGGFSAWESGANYRVEGLAADRGTVYSDFQEFRTFALNVSADNVATIVRSISGTGTARTPDVPLYNVLPGEARLLRNGTIIQYANETLHPRTGVGLSADARRLYLMTVDGRNSGHSLGVTRPELADFMRMFGSVDAINLDGGGSTTLVFSDPTPRIVNVPVGVNDVPGTERTVGSNFGVVALPVPPPAAVTVDVASGTHTQASMGHPLFVSTTSLAKTGAGTLVLDRANVFAGATTVHGGTLRIENSRALAGSAVTVLGGATLEVANGLAMAGPGIAVAGGTLVAGRLEIGGTAGCRVVTVNGGAVAAAPDLVINAGGIASFAGATQAVALGSLAVDLSAGGGRLDIGSARVDIARGFSAADIVAGLTAGYDGGSWDGSTGIVSTTAANRLLSVGWRDDGNGSGSIALAYPGDCNLDGLFDMLDIVDFTSAGRFNSGEAATWSEGDFNYDGRVDLLDVAGAVSAGGYGAGAVTPPVLTAMAAVPEPSARLQLCAGLAGVAAMIVLGRRASVASRFADGGHAERLEHPVGDESVAAGVEVDTVRRQQPPVRLLVLVRCKVRDEEPSEIDESRVEIVGHRAGDLGVIVEHRVERIRPGRLLPDHAGRAENHPGAAGPDPSDETP